MNQSLRPCPACGQQVSYDADFCPHCGKPFRARHSVFYYVCAVIGSLILLGIIAAVAWGVLVVAPAAARNARMEQIHSCENNLKQIGLAARTWALDHNDRYPWNCPKTEGGSLEFCKRGADGYDENVVAHLMAMTNELYSPRILVCSDDSRPRAEGWAALQPTNISYKLCAGPEVSDQNPENIIAVCPIHHLALLCDGSVGYRGSYRAMTNDPVSWTAKSQGEAAEKQADARDRAARERLEQAQAADQKAAFEAEWAPKLSRTWTYKNGIMVVEGKFVGFQGNYILVRHEEGDKVQDYALEIQKLCDLDQKIAAKLAAK